MTDSPVTIESLLVHAGWLRELSRRLVGEAAADDLVQDVWLQASRRPPRHGSSPRAWLATVLRHSNARRVARDLAARDREVEAARAEALPSTAELTGRAEAQRWLVEAVLALEDPWRATLLLHFFEGSSAAEIARRDGVPTSTVRTRIARGVDLLRARLDARPGGRESWLSGVALLGFAPRGAEAGGLVASAAVPISLVVMWKAVVGVLSVAVVAWVAVAWLGEEPATQARGGEVALEEAPVEVPDLPAPEPVPLPVERESVSEEPPVEVSAQTEAVAAAPTRPANAIVGRVLDPWGEPIEGATVRNGTYMQIANRQGRKPSTRDLTATTDEEGRFALVVNERVARRKAPVPVSAKFPGFASSEIQEVDIEDLASAPEIELRLREGAGVTGTVYGLEEEPVASRPVYFTSPDLGDRCEVETDADGRFAVDGLIPGPWRVATHPEDDELERAGLPTGGLSSMGHLAQLEFTLEARDTLEIELGKVSPDSPRVSGTITATAGEVFELFQWYRPRHSNETQTCLIDDDGKFEIVLPHPGRWVAFANTFNSSSRGQRWVFEFAAGEERELQLVLDGAQVSGRVVDGAGTPLEGVRVELLAVDDSPHRPTATIGGGWERTGAEGRYVFELVEPGTWTVVLHGAEPKAEGAAIAADGGPVFEVGASDLELDDIVAVDGLRLAIRVVDAAGAPVSGASLWFHDGAGRPLNPLTDTRTGSDGTVTSPALPPGQVSVSATLRTGAAAPATVEIGLDTEVELTVTAPHYVDVDCDASLDPILEHWRLTDDAGRRWLGLYDRRRVFDSVPVRDDPERPLLGPLPRGRYTLEIDGKTTTFELGEQSPEVTVLRVE